MKLPRSLRSLLIFVGCFAYRLLPFRAPNLEPLLASQLPIAKRQGALAGFCFGFLSIVGYDLVTAGLGPWTWLPAVVYGLLGLGAAWVFRKRALTRWNSVAYALVATLLYDAATGLTIGPLVWHQSLMGAVVGQIPFTLMHLAGNTVLAAALTPLLDRFLAAESPAPASVLNQKNA